MNGNVPSHLLLLSSDDAKVLPQTTYGSEAQLQTLLRTHPQLLPFPGRRFAFLAAEVACEAGSIDLLFLDDEGVTTLVETKLLRNPEARREVLAQTLDYAASLAHQWSSSRDASLADVADGVLDRVNTLLEEGVDPIDFVRAADRRLAAGEMRLVLALDQAPDRLMRLVNFLNEHSSLEVYVLEVRYYALDGRQVLAPALIGYKERLVTAASSRSPARASDTLAAVYAAVDRLDVEWDVGNLTRSYFQVHIPRVRRSLHYEVLENRSTLFLALHLEYNKKVTREPFLQFFRERVQGYSELVGARVVLEEKWPQFCIELSRGEEQMVSPDEAALLLKRLIETTQQDVVAWAALNGCSL